MGDMADFINDQDPYPMEEDQGPATWTTSEGDVILISEMTNPHLINALRMMERKGFIPAEEVTDFLLSSRPNGDAAMDAWNQELDQILEKKPSSKMADLVAEAMQRNLEWRA